MKFIQKNSPPSDLVLYSVTANASYNDLYTNHHDIYELVKLSLLEEQGYICCYCGRRLRFGPNTHIEHLYAKGTSYYQTMQLDYGSNLLACCDGGQTERKLGTCRKEDLFCEAVKDSKILPISPLTIECEEKFLFDSNGTVVGVGKDAEVVIEILNLNSPIIKNKRKAAIDYYKQYPVLNWHNELSRLKLMHDGKFEEFCFVLEKYIEVYHDQDLKRESGICYDSRNNVY